MKENEQNIGMFNSFYGTARAIGDNISLRNLSSWPQTNRTTTTKELWKKNKP